MNTRKHVFLSILVLTIFGSASQIQAASGDSAASGVVVENKYMNAATNAGKEYVRATLTTVATDKIDALLCSLIAKTPLGQMDFSKEAVFVGTMARRLAVNMALQSLTNMAAQASGLNGTLQMPTGREWRISVPLITFGEVTNISSQDPKKLFSATAAAGLAYVATAVMHAESAPARKKSE